MCKTLELCEPRPWAWHDRLGRKNGQGYPLGIGLGVGKGIPGGEPALGNCSRFSYAVSDSDGFCVAHCNGPMITCSSERSEARARLLSAAPDEHEALYYLGGGSTYLEEYGRLCFCPAYGQENVHHSSSCDAAWKAWCKAEGREP